jgi:hypothetical protein
VIQYGVHFDPPEGDKSRGKPRVQSTGRGFESISLQRRIVQSDRRRVRRSPRSTLASGNGEIAFAQAREKRDPGRETAGI